MPPSGELDSVGGALGISVFAPAELRIFVDGALHATANTSRAEPEEGAEAAQALDSLILGARYNLAPLHFLTGEIANFTVRAQPTDAAAVAADYRLGFERACPPAAVTDPGPLPPPSHSA